MPIQRFLFSDLNIKGQHLQIDDAWQEMIKDRHYPETLSTLLGEVTLMTVFLANGLKHPGKITLQIQGKGPVNLLVVEATHDLKIRGVAKTNQTIEQQNTLDELLGDGQMLVTLNNEVTKKMFQSYVPRDGETLTECFSNYLSQSEQLPSKIWLASSKDSIGGVIIQKMPSTDQQDEDGWNRIQLLSDTVKENELTELDSTTLLKRLFAEEDISLFEANQIAYECPSDRVKVEKMLISLGQEEVFKIIESQGEIVVHNEICNYHERFTKEDAEKLFQPDQAIQ